MRMLGTVLELCVALFLIIELAIPMVMNKPMFPLTRGMIGDVFSSKKKDADESGKAPRVD